MSKSASMNLAVMLSDYFVPRAPEILAYESDNLFHFLTFITPEQAPDRLKDGWMQVGTLQGTLTLVDGGDVAARAIAALSEKIRAKEAETYKFVTEAKGQIQNLLALSYSAPVAAHNTVDFSDVDPDDGTY